MGLDDSQPPKQDQQSEQPDRDTDPHRQGLDRAIRASFVSDQEEKPGSQTCQDRNENGSNDDLGGHDLSFSFKSVVETRQARELRFRDPALLYPSMMETAFKIDKPLKIFRHVGKLRSLEGLMLIDDETDSQESIVKRGSCLVVDKNTVR